MKILFDTHAWIWMHQEPERLSKESRATLADRTHELYLSAVVPWEMSIKHARGRLRFGERLDDVLATMILSVPAALLPISHPHALRVARLPLHHRDPFDRMLIAQAQVEGLTILTADRRFRDYEVKLIAA